MRYRRPGPSIKMVIIPSKTSTINGRTEFQQGLYADFTGNPPICDTALEAKRYVDWERKTRKINPLDKKAYDKKLAQVETEVMQFIESHEEYIDHWDEKATNRIMKEIPPVEQTRLMGLPVCNYCDRVLETSAQLNEHQKTEHREELLKELEQVASGPEEVNDKDPADFGTSIEV
jgi:hypothetical protein